MLKTQIITNTWECDCCGLDTEAPEDPYYNFNITSPKTNGTPIFLQIDLCSTCILLLQAQPIIDFVASVTGSSALE